MKFLLAISFALVAVFVHQIATQSHNISWGQIGSSSCLIDSEVVIKKWKFLRVVSENFTFPPEGSYNNQVITAVQIVDQYTNGDGGYASLITGGPGYTSVEIHLKSRRDHGFNFIIEVYGQCSSSQASSYGSSNDYPY